VQMVSMPDVDAMMASRVPSHMVPDVYFALPRLPMTTSGNLQSCYQSVRTDKTDWVDCQGSVSTVSVQRS
jgi:hypothetical protein